MSQFYVTPRAARDLGSIAVWTLNNWGVARMESYLLHLDERFRWLAAHPGAGRNRDTVSQGYRSFPEGQHVVFYLIQTDSIAIIAIPHQSMDIDSFFA